MHQRPTGEGKINLIRSDLVLKNMNLAKFIDLTMNLENFRTKQHKEMKMIEKIDEDTSIWFMRVKMPLFADREILIEI